MPGQSLRNTPPSPRLLFAHMACLCLGVALLLWSLAPAAVERILTGRVPQLQTFVLGSATFVVGLGFIGLHRLVRRGVRWALWTAFATALMIATAAVAAAILSSASKPSLFSLVFAGGTTVATWLALAERPDERASVRK